MIAPEDFCRYRVGSFVRSDGTNQVAAVTIVTIAAKKVPLVEGSRGLEMEAK